MLLKNTSIRIRTTNTYPPFRILWLYLYKPKTTQNCQFYDTNKIVVYISLEFRYNTYGWPIKSSIVQTDKTKRKLFFFLLYLLSIHIDLTKKFVPETCIGNYYVEKCNNLLLDLGLDCSLISIIFLSQFTNITVLKRPVYLYICNIANLTNKFGPLCWWPEFWILFGELLPVPKCWKRHFVHNQFGRLAWHGLRWWRHHDGSWTKDRQY